MSGTAETQSWGNTTMMFLRESRWGKALAFANFAGLFLAIVGVFLVQFGFYPVSLRFRVVDRTVSEYKLKSAMQTRFDGAALTSVQIENRYDRTLGLSVMTLQRNRDWILERLAIENDVKLVWLKSVATPDASEAVASSEKSEAVEPSESSATDVTPTKGSFVGIAPGLALSDNISQKLSGLGPMVQCASEFVPIMSEHVSRVRKVNPSDSQQAEVILVEFSAAGRQAVLDATDAAEETGGIGLVVDGVVEAIASENSLTAKGFRFQLAEDSELTASAIMAGLRGPALETDLELLN